MSNNSHEIITEAKPHTIKKFELIERYVDEWRYKLLENDHCSRLFFIDCMCNSGEYYDESKNIIKGTAIRVANKLLEASVDYPKKNVHMFFNDINQERIEHLKSILPEESRNCKIHVSCKDANELLKDLSGLILSSRNTHSLLVYDPYEATIDWDAVMPYFNIWGEVILNHMVSDATRGIKTAKRTETIEKYEKTYKTSFDNLLPYGSDKKAYEKRIEDIIKTMRVNTSRDLYIAAFPFFNRTNNLIYNLIHYTSNSVGFELFKKCAWKTFDGKSSLKNTHGMEDQYTLDFLDSGFASTIVDEDCFYIKDIAEYLQTNFSGQKDVPLDTLWTTLKDHPVFPSDGFKSQIKKELKDNYGAVISGKSGDRKISFLGRGWAYNENS